MTEEPSPVQPPFEAEVANDGAAAIFNVEWLEDGVQICLDGEEQPAAYYILPYKNKTSK